MKEKYLYSERDAAALCDFLEPMLQPDMRQRADVRDLVDHPWLEPRYDDDFGDV
jgi:serine/threonine-protein kinase SRPK3